MGRFLYVPFVGQWDIEFDGGLFGFKWLSTFLSRIGNELAWVSVGFFIKFLLNFMKEDATVIKRYTSKMANLILITALYFISWIFYDGSNFSLITEMIFSLATSLTAFYLMSRLSHPILEYLRKLLTNIKMLVDVLIIKAPSHVKDQSLWEEEIVEPTLDKLNE